MPTLKYAQPVSEKIQQQLKDETKQGSQQQWSDKEKQDIEAGLGKLKGEEGAGEKNSFLERQSMGADSVAKPKISIPVSKKSSEQQPKDETKQGSQQQWSEKKIKDFLETNHKDIKSSESYIKKEEESFFKKPEFIKKDSKLASDKNKKETISNKNDNSIFGGKEEISRTELRQKLRLDPNVAKAQRDLYMNLSPVERAKLESTVFHSAYGGNISKSDLKSALRKLGTDLSSTSDMKRKETLRKQIKFFKKIGGVK
jgi:hypothetical protein